MKEKMIEYRGKQHLFSEKMLKLCEKNGIAVNKEYLDYLYQFCGPIDNNDIQFNFLIIQDYYNRKFFSPDNLGKIVRYDVNGQNEEYIEDFEHFFSQDDIREHVYGVQFLHEKGDRVTRKGISFYGIKFKPMYDQMSYHNSYLISVNYWSKRAEKMRKSKSSKAFDDPYIRSSCGNITFEEYKEKLARNYIFNIGYALKCSHQYYIDTLLKRGEIDNKIYNFSLECLLTRYTIHRNCLFKNVIDLGEYRNVSGIYVLCFDEPRVYYIGQAKKDLVRRIKDHWMNPSSSFDNTFGPNDVSKIYIMRIPSDYCDRVEQDCIASIPVNLLFNSMAGGNAIANIHSCEYDQRDYLLKADELDILLREISSKQSDSF